MSSERVKEEENVRPDVPLIYLKVASKLESLRHVEDLYGRGREEVWFFWVLVNPQKPHNLASMYEARALRGDKEKTNRWRVT